MANVAITNRMVMNHGSFRKETGTFVDPGVPYEVPTGVGRIVWFRFRGISNAINSGQAWINSTTASATEDDLGVIHIEGGLTASATYGYMVIGAGVGG